MKTNPGEESPQPQRPWERFEDTVDTWRRTSRGCPGDEALGIYWEGLGSRWQRLRLWWHIRRCALCRIDLRTLDEACESGVLPATRRLSRSGGMEGRLGGERQRPWIAAWAPALTVGLALWFVFTVRVDRRLLPVEALLPQASTPRITRGSVENDVSPQTLARLIQQGLHYEHSAQLPQAIAAYQAALDQVVIPLQRLAELFEQQGEAAQGIPLARLAVQLRPDVAENLSTLAVLLCRVGEQEEARHWLEKAAKLQPQTFLPKLEIFAPGTCR